MESSYFKMESSYLKVESSYFKMENSYLKVESSYLEVEGSFLLILGVFQLSLEQSDSWSSPLPHPHHLRPSLVWGRVLHNVWEKGSYGGLCMVLQGAWMWQDQELLFWPFFKPTNIGKLDILQTLISLRIGEDKSNSVQQFQ